MNEGHSAFLAIERIGRVMRDRGVPFHVAAEANSAGNVFTTHTPVPAGNDAFEPDLVRTLPRAVPRAARHLRGRAPRRSGAIDPGDQGAPFSMPVLAIHTSDHYNGVSELHGEVSRKMWQGLWPELPTHEIPIESITNGVHTASWVASEMGALFTRYLGPRWAEQCDDAELWARTTEIPDAELWQVHEHRRHRLVQHARRWLRAAAERRGARSRGPGAGRRGARPARADHRLRAALRDVQAGDPALHRPRAREEAARRPAAPRAARLRGQGAPAGPRRQGAHPIDHPREPRLGPPRARRLPRGLRHAHGARARERRRRLAQHAPTPLRGERYERDEGGGQRRAGPERPRRLVRRGMGRSRLGGRLGDRARRRVPRTAPATRARPSFSTMSSSARSCRCSSHARARRACREAGSSG